MPRNTPPPKAVAPHAMQGLSGIVSNSAQPERSSLKERMQGRAQLPTCHAGRQLQQAIVTQVEHLELGEAGKGRGQLQPRRALPHQPHGRHAQLAQLWREGTTCRGRAACASSWLPASIARGSVLCGSVANRAARALSGTSLAMTPPPSQPHRARAAGACKLILCGTGCWHSAGCLHQPLAGLAMSRSQSA